MTTEFPVGPGELCHKVFRVVEDENGQVRLASAVMKGALQTYYEPLAVMRAPVQGFFTFESQHCARNWAGRTALPPYEVWQCIGWGRMKQYKILSAPSLNRIVMLEDAMEAVRQAHLDGDWGPTGTMLYRWLMPWRKAFRIVP